MAKNLIIGAAIGYDYNQLKPWVESIDEIGFGGDKVLIVGNNSTETLQCLSDKGFDLIDIGGKQNFPPHVLRFLFIYDYLKQYSDNYDYVLTTDVKDVYFQLDPFKKYICTDLIVGSESLKYKDESWGNDNLLQTFGPYIHNDFKDSEIFNVGVIGGKSDYVKDLCLHIFINSINRPISIVDQAVFNLMMATQPYKDITQFNSQSSGFVCHAGTTADPSKINNFRPNLLEPEPIWEDNLVKTSTGIVFSIVHQYDRVPEWKKYIATKYNQEPKSNYFVYKTS
jgi:hypothetical protein